MLAWTVRNFGEPTEALRLEERPSPEIGPDEVRVRVHAAGIGFPDLLTCRGTYQTLPDLPFTPGVDVSGTVIAHGDDVTDLPVGTLIMGAARAPHGSFAQESVLARENAYRVPDGLSPEHAGGFLIGFQTAWFGLVRRARLVSGETVLVHAASGGVGGAAVHLAKALGARVIAVVGDESKAAHATELGADEVIVRGTEDIADAVNRITGGRGADVVFDPVGGDAYDRSTKCIAFEGRIVVVGFAGGRIQQAALNHALVKNYSIVGLHLSYYRKRAPHVIDESVAALTELLTSGRIRPRPTELVDFSRLPEAMQRLADGRSSGRLTLVMG